MKMITWNVNRASLSRVGTWKLLEQEDADIVLLQEVTRIPDEFLRHYNCHARFPKYFEDGNAPYQTVVLSKWRMNTTPFLASDVETVKRIQSTQYGWIHECEVVDGNGARYRVVAVLSHANAVPLAETNYKDFSALKLKNNRKLFFTEILWSLLQNANPGNDTNWIVGGDFNSSVRFDDEQNRGNREVIERLNDLGLKDCLSHHNGQPVPTFQHSSKAVEDQLDYLYVNAPLLDRLTSARVPGHDEVFGTNPRLSDHLPIVCEFD